MSIKVISWYWDHSTQEGHKLLLLLALADWANEEGECFPSMSGLAKRARRDKRSIQRTIKDLEASGEILVCQGMGKGQDGQRSPLYYLLKYRQANSIRIPPTVSEAASYYRERSRKQGKQGIEVRKAQAALLSQSQGVTQMSPVGGDVDVTRGGDVDVTRGGDVDVTRGGDVDVTRGGDVDVTQIRQYDPSVLDPSEGREIPVGSTDNPSAPPAIAHPPPSLIARAIELADKESFDPPSSKPSSKPTSKPKPPTSPRCDGRKFQGGYIPAGAGTTPVEVYYESFSISEAKLSAPNEDDLTRECTDLDRLRSVLTAYRRSNYRKGNVQLILDWYRDGVPAFGGVQKLAVTEPANPTAKRRREFRQWLINAYHTDQPKATAKPLEVLEREFDEWTKRQPSAP